MSVGKIRTPIFQTDTFSKTFVNPNSNARFRVSELQIKDPAFLQ